MGVAYYIVLDCEEPGFDTFVNGKSIARETRRLDRIAKKLGVPKLDDFNTMSGDELADLLGEEIDLPEIEEQWFTADEGLAWAAALIQHIQANPGELKDSEGVLADLHDYQEVLGKAKAIGARWHLSLDI